MTDKPFASVPSRAPVALIDLVETATPETGHAFVTQAFDLVTGKCRLEYATHLSNFC